MTAPGMFTNTTASFANWIAFLDNQVAVANGDPVNGEFELWRTTDGGLTFTMVPGANIPNPQTNEFAIVDMYATFGPSHIWFGTNQGRVYRSADAGVTWSVSNVSSVTSQTSTVIEVRFASPTNGLCMIVSGNTTSLYNTFNGGATWNLIPAGQTSGLPANYGANEMANVPGTNYFVSAGNGNGTTTFQGISYSRDNGVTWTDWGSTGIGYTTIDFSDRWTGWAGSFTNFPDNSWPGVFKYNGNTFNTAFTVPQAICMGSSNATVTPFNNSSSPDGPLTFTWSSVPAAVFSSNSASVPLITFQNPGTYTVTLISEDPDGTSTLSQVITVASCVAPAASFTVPATGCNNSILTLTNTSTGGPAPSVTITVNPSNNVVVSGGAGNQYNVFFGDPGTYTVTMDAASISGTSSATQTVQINDCRPQFNFSFNMDSVCRLDTVFIHHNLGSSANGFTWTIQPPTGISSFINVTHSTSTVPNKRVVFQTSPLTFSITSYTLTLKVANPYGVTEHTIVIFVDALNCQKVALEQIAGWPSQFMVFPNPAHELINITVPASENEYEVRVYNLLGSIIHKQTTRGGTNVSVPLTGHGKGVYFVEVQSAGTKVTGKFILD
jgi:hypothetical protein